MQNKQILTNTHRHSKRSHTWAIYCRPRKLSNMLPVVRKAYCACASVCVCVHKHVPKQMKWFSTINNNACYVPCAEATWLLRGNNPCNSNMKVHSNIVAVVQNMLLK